MTTGSPENDNGLGPILERIVRAKREEVAHAKRTTPLPDAKHQAESAPPARDFRTALCNRCRVALIAEVKKASPSKGVIRENFDPIAIANAYVRGGASALSVLTDNPFFQGSLDIFRAVRGAVGLPMLRKDFMIDAYQFYEARAAGADAVLLITSILSDETLSEFHALALSLGMSVLVETHSENDIRRALKAIPEPSLLGINNRDLGHADFHTEITHTARMLPIVREIVGKGPMPPLVSESGIRTPDDVAQLGQMGVSAVLVGESLMRQSDPGAAARELMAKSDVKESDEK
jgi:indole-3-glycerol phosphate synthase